MLDAQYFGVPQRRRRVFVLSCFNPAVASRSPEKILTVGESSGGNSAKGKPKGQSATNEAAEGFGNSGFSKWAGTDQAITLSARDYKGPNTLMVEEPLGIVGSLQARDYKGVGNQYVMENKLVVQQTPTSAA